MHYQHNYSQSHKSLTTFDDSKYEQIIRSIQSLDKQNQKLVTIADNIMKTSFLRQAQQTPAVIMQLEEDLKVSFNELIESIREFFISIDNKLKMLACAIQKKVELSPDLVRSKFSSRTESDRIDTLTVRMGVMQDNMKRAQENEARLISILQEVTKRKSYDQQPTILKQSPKTMPSAGIKHNTMTDSQKQSSFRLFSLGQGSQLKCMFNSSQTNPTYKRFQQYSNYPVLESLGPYQNGKTLQTGPFFCSAPRVQNQKITIKQGNMRDGMLESELQSSNRIHRLSNLMKALKN